MPKFWSIKIYLPASRSFNCGHFKAKIFWLFLLMGVFQQNRVLKSPARWRCPTLEVSHLNASVFDLFHHVSYDAGVCIPVLTGNGNAAFACNFLPNAASR